MQKPLVLALSLVMLSGASPPKVNLAPPIEDEQYGDWRVSQLKNGWGFAAVSNNAGSAFGSVCSPSGCSAFFNPKIKCDDGDQYPGLVNAPSAAFAVTLTCEKAGDGFIYTMPLSKGIMDAMSIGGMLGVAFPMQSGQFQVARFSLTGAARATARATQIGSAQSPTNRQNASDDFAL